MPKAASTRPTSSACCVPPRLRPRLRFRIRAGVRGFRVRFLRRRAMRPPSTWPLPPLPSRRFVTNQCQLAAQARLDATLVRVRVNDVPSEDRAAMEAAIYEQSFRALDEQARVLDGLRARAGSLVGAATVATAFVGGLAATSERAPSPKLSVVAWVAIALYLSVVVLSLLISSPGRSWVFAH